MKFLYFLLLFSPFLQAQNIQRKDILMLPIEVPVTFIEMQEITFSKGVSAPAHLHPCIVLGYVISGRIKYQKEGQDPQILKKGDYFLEPANTIVTHFDNISKRRKVRFLAIYLKEDKEQFNMVKTDTETFPNG